MRKLPRASAFFSHSSQLLNFNADMKPKRIQLSRKKNWRKPLGAVVVSRPSKWGNQFIVGTPGVPDAATAVIYFRRSMEYLDAEDFAELRGKDLCCWCPLSSPCHADVLLELANR